MKQNELIYIAGHSGMVGSAIVRLLESKGYTNLLMRRSSELDLRDQLAVNQFFKKEKPDYIFLAAAKVGGIYANNIYRADFIYDNLIIAANVIHAAYVSGAKKLLNLGSSCIYPKLAEQPLKEESLLTGALEPTNESYAIAKIAAIKLCDAYRAQYGCHFISGMPTNLYGPNDNYHLENSHVVPALIRKFHEAKKNKDSSVTLWGTGSPLREFLHVDDLARACIHLMEYFDDPGPINIGSGEEVSIIELANLIREVVGYQGNIQHDLTKPDGTPRKLMDNSRINKMGWQASISLESGLRQVYSSLVDEAWYS